MAGRGSARGRASEEDRLPVMVTICFENKDQTMEGHSAARRGQDPARCRGRHRRDELPASPGAHARSDGRDAQSGGRFSGVPAGRLPDTERQAGLYQLAGISLCARSLATHAQGDGRLCGTARDIGINYIGACCGSVASHVREMARVLGKLPENSRIWKKGGEKPMSAYEYYDHDKLKVGSK